MTELTVLDLFAGLGGATSAFKERGHRVVTVDNNPAFDTDLICDGEKLDVGGLQGPHRYDFVWASPPCTCFSVMTISNYWTSDGEPKEKAQDALDLVRHTIEVVERLDPAAWILENPVGMLRAQDVVQDLHRRTVTYCQYGLPYRKATNLFGRFPPNLKLRPPCKPGGRCHEAPPRGSKAGVQLVGYDDDPPPERKEEPLVKDTETSAPYIQGGEGATPMERASIKYLRENWEKAGTGSYSPDKSAEASPDRAALRALVPYELSLEVCRAVEAMVEEGWTWRDGTLERYGVVA